ncbi:hypothetical protein TIFTF001_049342 [Ficus carica]|uniref:Uncharacterized protein n=1 Tax=Ficus carica TaxID=3494 RepID=A0AA88CRX7_FICCA|nr:hypothetical protein TIFTF001_049342 [Ficus carica]
MGSTRRDLRNGAHLCPFHRRSTSVKVGQRRSKLVNAGQRWSTVTEFWKIAFRPIFDVPDMFTTSDLQNGISKVKNGD